MFCYIMYISAYINRYRYINNIDMADRTGQPPKALDMIISYRYVSIYSQAKNDFLSGRYASICVSI